METKHELWMNLVKAFYNKRYKELSGMVVLQIADLIIKQRKKCERYGMADGRFERAVSDLLSTFFTRTFKNMMPLILEVLEKMKTDYTKERETICVSYGRHSSSSRSGRPFQVCERSLRLVDGLHRLHSPKRSAQPHQQVETANPG